MKKNAAILQLLLVTVIWGGGFTAIKICLNYGMTSGTLNMCRGVIFSLLCLVFFHRQIFSMSQKTFKLGLLAGVFNSLAFILQGMGAQLTKPSNSSFLSSISVVMVPFMVWGIFKIRPKAKNLVAVAVCVAGMAVLTDMINQGFSVNIGDVYTIAGSFFFGMSVVVLSRQPEGAHFSQSAFLLALTLFAGGVIYALYEEASFSTVKWGGAILPLLYLAVLSNFLAQSLQIESQRYMPASTASLIMTLEGVFGSVFSVMFGFEPFTQALLVGGSLIFASLIICEGDFSKLKKRRKAEA